MVSTRRKALVPDGEASNVVESSNKVGGASTTKGYINTKSTPHTVAAENTRQRKRGNTKPDVRPAKRAAPWRPTASRPSNTVMDDEHEDDIPDDALLKDINEKAAHKLRAKRTLGAGQDVDAAAEAQLLRESQGSEEILAAQDEEEGPESRQKEGADGPECDEEGTEDGKESDIFVQQDNENELEQQQQESRTDNGNCNDNEPVVATSAAPQASQIEMEERSRRAKQARELREQRDKQMKLFVASTQRTAVEVPQNRDEYFDKHGWQFSEDEILLEAIRNAKSPDLAVLSKQIPHRSKGVVKKRIRQLRERMQKQYEAAGRRPPKWCYY